MEYPQPPNPSPNPRPSRTAFHNLVKLLHVSPFGLDGIALPNLQCLDVGFPYNVCSGLFDIYVDDGWLEQRLVPFLENCPSLVELRLHNCDFRTSNDTGKKLKWSLLLGAVPRLTCLGLLYEEGFIDGDDLEKMDQITAVLWALIYVLALPNCDAVVKWCHNDNQKDIVWGSRNWYQDPEVLQDQLLEMGGFDDEEDVSIEAPFFIPGLSELGFRFDGGSHDELEPVFWDSVIRAMRSHRPDLDRRHPYAIFSERSYSLL